METPGSLETAQAGRGSIPVPRSTDLSTKLGDENSPDWGTYFSIFVDPLEVLMDQILTFVHRIATVTPTVCIIYISNHPVPFLEAMTTHIAHSLGANLLTPAAMLASMRFF